MYFLLGLLGHLCLHAESKILIFKNSNLFQKYY